MIEMIPPIPVSESKIAELIEAIDKVIQDSDADPCLQINALSFYLLGIVQVHHKLERGVETAEFCAKYFKNYAEQIKWGGANLTGG
jgi:hypothetical protein